jgi:hypothetical protein
MHPEICLGSGLSVSFSGVVRVPPLPHPLDGFGDRIGEHKCNKPCGHGRKDASETLRG